MTRSSPAAVESAAPRAPAAARAITHGGSRAISGFARTRTSGSTVTSFRAGSAERVMRPSPSLSVKATRFVPLHSSNHAGGRSAGLPWSDATEVARAKTATAGAVV